MKKAMLFYVSGAVLIAVGFALGSFGLLEATGDEKLFALDPLLNGFLLKSVGALLFIPALLFSGFGGAIGAGKSGADHSLAAGLGVHASTLLGSKMSDDLM